MISGLSPPEDPLRLFFLSLRTYPGIKICWVCFCCNLWEVIRHFDCTISRMTLSTAQLLMNRRLRDKLPVYSKSLRPGVMSDACQQLRDHQRQYTKLYETGVKPLMKLQVGDAAHVKTRQGWVPVVVSSKLSSPRSYLVTTANGRSYRRNRWHLQTSPFEPMTIRPLLDVGEFNIPLEEVRSTVDMAPTPPSSAENSQYPQPPSRRSQHARA